MYWAEGPSPGPLARIKIRIFTEWRAIYHSHGPASGGRFPLKRRRGDQQPLSEVIVGDGESFEAALRRFNKKIQQAGILAEARRREFYERPAARRKGGRDDLVEKEEKELGFINAYLPEQLDESKIREIARRVIAETGAKGPQDTKLVMPKVIAETKGRADGKVVSGVVGALLKEGAA